MTTGRHRRARAPNTAPHPVPVVLRQIRTGSARTKSGVGGRARPAIVVISCGFRSRTANPATSGDAKLVPSKPGGSSIINSGFERSPCSVMAGKYARTTSPLGSMITDLWNPTPTALLGRQGRRLVSGRSLGLGNFVHAPSGRPQAPLGGQCCPSSRTNAGASETARPLPRHHSPRARPWEDSDRIGDAPGSY